MGAEESGVISPSEALASPASHPSVPPLWLGWPFLVMVSLPPGQPVPVESEGELCQGHCFGDGE